MKSLITTVAGVVLSGFFLIAMVYAQHGPGAGNGHGNGGGPGFNVDAVETVVGTVRDVQFVSGGEGRVGVHLTLDVEDDSLAVHLGPQWYIADLGVSFHAGDAVTVEGSRVLRKGAPALIAARLIRGNDELVLRDETGRPAWRGKGRMQHRGG